MKDKVIEIIEKEQLRIRKEMYENKKWCECYFDLGNLRGQKKLLMKIKRKIKRMNDD